MKTFPLSSTVPLAGGGTRYYYDLGNGQTVSTAVPPAGFSTATATPAQLREYGFPPRPTNSEELASWDKLQESPPPPFLVGNPVNADGQSSAAGASSDTTDGELAARAFAGFEVVGQDGTFDFSEARWTEPAYGQTVCDYPDAVIWSAVGAQDTPQPIFGQDGTSFGIFAPHEPWFEVVGTQTIDNGGSITQFPVPMSPEPSAGDAIGSYVYYDELNKGYDFLVWDYTTNKQVSYDWSDTRDPPADYYKGDGVQAIVERPRFGPYIPSHLANFGKLSFTYAQADSTTMDNYPRVDGELPFLHQIQMFKNMANVGYPFIGPLIDGLAPQLATTSDIGANGSFSVQQDHCGSS